ncbi:MAG TPA: hypothetical protein VF456_02130 [Vicinamibacterales bacterium]
MNTAQLDEPEIDTRQRIGVAGGLALLAAGLTLVIVVLPAEYGVDPLGTGARLGLLPLGIVGQQVDALNHAAAARDSAQSAVVAGEEHPFHQETVEFRIEPREFLEYKYRLDKGQALLYSWTATSAVNYELHAEPDGAPRGYAESYEKKPQTEAASGTLTAPFSGIHGWYWENTADHAVTVTLKSAGFYSMSHEFHKDAPVKNKVF